VWVQGQGEKGQVGILLDLTFLNNDTSCYLTVTGIPGLLLCLN
jgi:hypothetical protein